MAEFTCTTFIERPAPQGAHGERYDGEKWPLWNSRTVSDLLRTTRRTGAAANARPEFDTDSDAGRRDGSL